MALLDLVRSSVRVTSDMTDDELQMLIFAAIADMRRCGVKENLLVESDMNPIAKNAVVCYVKANYGYDNPEADRFMGSYRMMLVALLNSKSNEYLFPDEGEQGGEEPTGDDPTGGDPTGDEPTGDEPTGDEPAGGDTTGNESTGDEPTGGEPTGEGPESGEPADGEPTDDQGGGDG